MEGHSDEKIKVNESIIEETKKEAEKEEINEEKPLYFERLIADLEDFPEEELKEGLGNESDDLFGDDTSESEKEAKEGFEGKIKKIEETQEKLEDFEYQEARRVLESTLSNYAAPESTDGELYYIKMPNFLTVVEKPFDSNSYLEEACSEYEETTVNSYDNYQRIRLRIENTIRWRYVKNSDGTYSKESNARFLKWSDGSLSLLLGSELFSVVIKNSISDYMYLSISHETQSLLMSRKRFTKNMTFLPIDTRSSTHKRLTEAILRGNMKKSSIIEFINIEDPEKVKREAERIEEEKIRFRRRLESKRRARNARYNESPILTIEGLEAEETNDRFSGIYTKDDNYDDDDDGFIVDDESDEAERAERLRRVKEEGIKMYKRQQTSLTNENDQNEKKDTNVHWLLNEQDRNLDDTDYMKEIDLDDNIIGKAGKRRRIVDELSGDELTPVAKEIKNGE
ncbi:hypothetical protein PNEG_01134 [Pneumocystis murina B123]|uniref:Leo1-like protein n=1 Tax=Pneumocystis murina (strain B123) TaxID=1069680 RepID=M7PIZ2_PNEMU|nr:hypothetical protein PNEG_01134 [Pneumocystis murina B123]EMR10419.1 hypothetical protein PNEG_01134 [Pneumocystis murina B123]